MPNHHDARDTDALLVRTLMETLADEPLLKREIGNVQQVLSEIDEMIRRAQQSVKAAEADESTARTRLDTALDLKLKDEAHEQRAALESARQRASDARGEAKALQQRRSAVEAGLPQPETVNVLRAVVESGDADAVRGIVQQLVAWVDLRADGISIYLSGSPRSDIVGSTGSSGIYVTAAAKI